MPVLKLRRDQLSKIRLSETDNWVVEVDYLKTIDELLSWFPKPKTSDASVISFVRRATTDTSKLLVCHDFKGGYTEDLFERGYSFEFWHLVDTFVYFSHNRVTIPPRGWIEAAHRREINILGTLIFEWEESKLDLSKCLYHGTPYTTPDFAQPTFAVDSAMKLVELARDRNFDGYLLNIETNLNFLPPKEFYPSGREERDKDEEAFWEEQTLAGMGTVLSPDLCKKRMERMQRNALAIKNWTAYIREEGKRLVGSHFEIIWYDSVTTAGNLEWQDALTPLNAPFFMAAGNIFTNYTWASPSPPTPPGGFPPTPELKYHPKLLQSFETAKSLNQPSSNVFEGIDVFGRNCYGGFDISKSLDMIFPTLLPSLGLSVAIFAPGWTWERAKDDGTRRSWTEWWDDDLRLWLGPSDPDSDACPIGAYFGPRQRSRSCTDPTNVCLPFYTNFGRGSGNFWWMFGRRVYIGPMPTNDQPGTSGWTDIGASFPMPDRLWPRARILRTNGGELTDVALDDGNWTLKDIALSELDAWEGSSCLRLTITEVATFGDSLVPSVILPLCTLQASNVTAGEIFITVIAKVINAPEGYLTTLPYILWADDKPADVCSYTLSGSSTILSQSHIANGWCRTEVAARVQISADPSYTTPVIGLEITPTGLDKPTSHLSIECLIGSIIVSPVGVPRCLPSFQHEANWKRLESPVDSPPFNLWGILSWAETERYSHLGYFDIIVSGIPNLDTVSIESAQNATYLWLGSSTSEKQWNSFVVCGLDIAEVPNYSDATGTITFYVIPAGVLVKTRIYKLTLETSTI